MNQVFYHAAFGKMISTTDATDENGGAQSKLKSTYSIFTQPELETNIVGRFFFCLLSFTILIEYPLSLPRAPTPLQTSLQAEIESLRTKAAERRAEKIRAAQDQHQHHSDATMSSEEGIVV